VSETPLLPSWRAGATRDAIIAFLDVAETLPVDDRVAAFDNDGTLWCEKPTYLQYDFFEDALRDAARSDPTEHERPEYAAILDGDQATMNEIGLERIAASLAELFAGIEAEEFTARARAFMHRANHRVLGLPVLRTAYQPMLELLDELRRREFTIFIVTGGGTEFVRSISQELYGVAPEAVVGTLIGYEWVRRHDGHPTLRRTAHVQGKANEGAAKVSNIQTQLGRRPILAAGNSGGDREMLEWACAGRHPGMALVVDHDDGEREFRYRSVAATVAEPEPITNVAQRLGWTVVSMADDWDTVFPD